MAGIGLYGVYYSKATMTDGVVTAYGGVQTMGKAISATFEPNSDGGSPLYANNGIAEVDAAARSGGTLTVTVDELSSTAIGDLFGLTPATESSASGFNFTGSETANTVGVAFVRWKQISNDRAHYEAVIFSACQFQMPSQNFATLGESVEWQTPELSATVDGPTVTGAKPWMKKFNFTTQADAIAFITAYFAAPQNGGGEE